MKKSLLLLICLWSVLAVIIAGVIIAGLTFFNTAQIPHVESASATVITSMDYSGVDGVVVDEQLDISDVKELDFDISAGKVTVRHSESAFFQVVQYGENIPEQHIIEVSKNNSEVKVKSRGGFQLFGFSLAAVNNVDIYIPADYNGDLDISVSAGGLVIADDFSVAELDVDVSAGGFSSNSRLEAKDAEIELSAGELDVSELVAKKFSISSSAGSIHLGNLTGSGKISSSAGKIKVDSISMTGDLTVRSSAGAIEIALSGDPSLEYQIHASGGSVKTYFGSSSGGKKISGTYGSAPFMKLDASSSAGSVTITQA